MVMDERVAETFTAPGDEIERVMYTYSVLCCLPVGLADTPSVGTGTVMRADTLRRYATEAGFADVEVLPIEHDVFRFYRLRGDRSRAQLSPSVAQTSSLERTREMTSSVNSVVEACPPRSAVRVPADTASRQASRIARPAVRASSSSMWDRSAAPARIMAIGFATSFPLSAGAVPCAASAMSARGV